MVARTGKTPKRSKRAQPAKVAFKKKYDQSNKLRKAREQEKRIIEQRKKQQKKKK